MEAEFQECNNIRGNKLFFAVTNYFAIEGLIDNFMKNDFGWIMFLAICLKSSWGGSLIILRRHTSDR